ncbi:MAG: hypothetical protein QME58_06740 [Bacteroidota bacterium]|nr:hypothetical protein [Bacteroidota bacterium]
MKIDKQLLVSGNLTLAELWKIINPAVREIESEDGVIIIGDTIEEKPVGSYEVEFDGSRSTRCVYFYRLQCNNFSETRKLLLLK